MMYPLLSLIFLTAFQKESSRNVSYFFFPFPCFFFLKNYPRAGFYNEAFSNASLPETGTTGCPRGSGDLTINLSMP